MDKTKEKSLQEKYESIQQLVPVDDVFFEVLADDIFVCQEMLRVIMEDDKLNVTDVIVQSSERNYYGRSVRLDALCTLGDGSKCNVEVQRSDDDDHLRRTRFNASVITARDSKPGTNFEDIINICVVYISKFDIFGDGKTIYRVDSVVRETGERVDDGFSRVFVNTAVDDGSTIAELMQCFNQKRITNPKFPALSKRMTMLKDDKGGLQAVCEIMEKYEKAAEEKGRVKERQKAIHNMIKADFTKEQILRLYSAEDYERALAAGKESRK